MRQRKAGRTLRSARDRMLLYRESGGKCQICGEDLGDDWHADHIVPWSITKRTTVFEMQALCKMCNLRKGATTMQHQRQMGLTGGFNWKRAYSAMRPGQASAIEALLARVETEQATTLVLPTRYGKSDVMRVAAYGLHQDGVVAGTFIAAPSLLLVEQLVLVDKMQAAINRYGLRGLRGRQIEKREIKYFPNGEHYRSMTLQLLHSDNDHFLDAIQSLHRTTGRRVLVMIDESHMVGDMKRWGESINRIMEEGAHVVLLTATAWREDGDWIPGFEVEVIEESEHRWHKVRVDEEQRKWIEHYSGFARACRLKPHWETTFGDAWQEEPSPLCKLSRLPFDVNLIEATGGEIVGKQWLKDLSPKDAREALGRVVRSHIVIREGVRQAIAQLRYYRQTDPNAAMIVFSESDDTVSGDNKHARDIERILLDEDPTLRIVIATSADKKDAVAGINRFVGDPDNKDKPGVGDVLIVKRMASVGLDCPRLKVQLDLSAVRSSGVTIQRWMRVATPFGRIEHGVIITPDDVLSRTLFESFITLGGGEFTSLVGEKIGEELAKVGPDKDRTLWIPESTDYSEFQDHTGRVADKAFRGKVDDLMDIFPEVIGKMSHAEVAERTKRFNITINEDQTPAASPNPDADIKDLKDDINGAVEEETRSRWRKLGIAYSSAMYGDVAAGVWRDVWSAAGVPYKWSVTNESDIEVLKRVLVAARMVAGGGYAAAS